MQHPAVTCADGRGVPTGLDALPAGLEAVDPDVGVVEERGEQPDRVGAAAHAGGDRVGEPAGQLEALGTRLVTDPAGEVADHARERVRAGGGAEQVGGVVDRAHPVAERLVDGVLERGAPGVDRDHPGSEQLHPRHVERLPLGVDRAHVDRAVEPEVGRRRRAGHAVLARAGLGDHPVLAHPPGQQGLAEHVADLVGAGVVEVLALEQDPRAADLLGEPGARRRAGWGRRRTPAGSCRSRPGTSGSAIAACQASVSSSSAATRASGMNRPPNRRRRAEPAALVGVVSRSCGQPCHRAHGAPRGRRP